ncbi:MAG TPA: cell wall-binding repeat-containing protein [Solirubrobacterales bacterium]|nr:cell wall-binding repeat-containing protein [Solirubrobacterales bacterium]
MSADRPINADVEGRQEPLEPADEPQPTEPPRPTEPGRRRPGIPGPIKLVAALVVIAIGFIVLAVVAGGGSGKDQDGAAPTVTTTVAAGESEASPSTSESGSGSDEAPSAGAEELGYPSFATSNTTRIGGPDPASNAAAAALAVFPGTSAKQRPVAVALVGTEDWAGAIAAAVLMAEPIHAPLLYGEPEGVPTPTAEALAALQPPGGAASGGDAAFAIGDVQVPDEMSAAKVPAADPATEAAAIARLRDRVAGSKPAAFILASSSEPAFAAPAAAYAARSGDPVLFTEANELPPETVAALRRHGGLPVYALGPSSAISNAVLREVEALGAKVHRIGGANPVATAIAFARFDGGKFGWHVSDPGHGFVLARSDAPLEAAAAAPLSASGTWGPLLLTDSADTLPSELRGYFLDVKPGYTTDPTRAFYNHVWIVGDPAQISVEEQAEVNEVAELAKIGSEE